MSRGRKKPSLHDLSREPFTEADFPELNKELMTGTDRSAAVIGSAIVEGALLQAVAARLAFPSDDDFEHFFFKPTAPMSTFAGRIRLGRALAIYGGQIQEMLDCIRRIRNVFAHSARPLLFNHPLVEAELETLPPATLSKEKIEAVGFDLSSISAHRERYLAVCLSCGIVLQEYAKRYGGKTVPIEFPDGPPRPPAPLRDKSR